MPFASNPSIPTLPTVPDVPVRDDTEAARRRAVASASTTQRTILTDEDERTAPAGQRSPRQVLGF